jgi:hypothetical protein
MHAYIYLSPCATTTDVYMVLFFTNSEVLLGPSKSHNMYIYFFIYIQIHIYLYVYLYIYLYIYMHIYIYIYIYDMYMYKHIYKYLGPINIQLHLVRMIIIENLIATNLKTYTDIYRIVHIQIYLLSI